MWNALEMQQIDANLVRALDVDALCSELDLFKMSMEIKMANIISEMTEENEEYKQMREEVNTLKADNTYLREIIQNQVK